MAEVKYEIVKHICVLSDRGNGWTREVNIVKWNDSGPKLDIREWSPERTSMRKGITLTRPEFLVLAKYMKHINASELTDGYRPQAPKSDESAAPGAESVPELTLVKADELKAASGE
jgi:hypothetical protein